MRRPREAFARRYSREGKKDTRHFGLFGKKEGEAGIKTPTKTRPERGASTKATKIGCQFRGRRTGKEKKRSREKDRADARLY